MLNFQRKGQRESLICKNILYFCFTLKFKLKMGPVPIFVCLQTHLNLIKYLCRRNDGGMEIDMREYLDVLRNCALFADISDENLLPMLNCLGAKALKFKKGQVVISEGEPADKFGILLSGEIQIMRIDYYGNRSIMDHIEPSNLFGESFACAEVQSSPSDVVATADSELLLVDAHRITKTCCNACDFHNKMIFNLLKIVATKNLVFNQKLEITSQRTTRDKLMTYLLIQAKKNNSSSFDIPFDRQELADYLEVDRSGLSVEIGKLVKEGKIWCYRSKFTLLDV